MSTNTEPRTARRTLLGVVSSTKMAKTIVVKVQRMVMHPLYKKYMKRSSIYKAHDEKCEAGVGDRVEIMETRRISKSKSFRLMRIVAKARIPAATPHVTGGIENAEG
ncbi:MAG: 30S ribosomal protein S17 [Planctomycetes bacterium]|nr:30S ribosomal protein S17 [Planctomycetota bacterium]